MKEYKVMVGDVEHTMQLDDDDAKRLGVSKSAPAAEPAKKAAPQPANKARTASNK